MSRRREEDRPRPLSDALSSFLKRAGLDERMAAASAVPEWPERVGERIAGVTRPLRVSDGTLLVAVRSSAWLMELRMMEREILRRVNEERQRGRIQAIRFVIDRGDDIDGGDDVAGQDARDR